MICINGAETCSCIVYFIPIWILISADSFVLFCPWLFCVAVINSSRSFFNLFKLLVIYELSQG